MNSPEPANCWHRSTLLGSRQSDRGSALEVPFEGREWPAPTISRGRGPSRRTNRGRQWLGGTLVLFWTALLIIDVGHVGAAPWLWSRSPDPPQRPHPAVVRVSVGESDGMSHGSGTLVDVRDRFGLVITNWHVVRDATGAIHVTFPDGFRSAARVLRVDRDWDLAALLIWRPRVTPVPIAGQAPQPGESLTIAGYGSGNYRAATGRCTQYLAPSERHPFEMVEIATVARQGDSGGPIFNSSGELAGVLFGSGGGTTSGSYAGRVRQFLRSAWPPGQESEFPESLAAGPVAAVPAPLAPAASLSAAPLRRLPDTASASTGPTAPRPMVPLPTAGPLASRGNGGEPAVAPQDTLESLEPPPVTATTFTWQDITGDSIFQQCKTFLALLGLFVLLAQLTRLWGPRGEAE